MRSVRFSHAVVAVVLGLSSGLVAGAYGPIPAAATASCPTSVFRDAVPNNPAVADSQGVELGVKVRTRGSVAIIGLRFYKSPENTGVHVGHLWSGDGGFLFKTVTFANETDSGWQEARFDSPIFPTAGTTLVASYFAPNGHYADDMGGLTAGAGDPDGPVYALTDGINGANGVYQYGGGFPTNGFYASNYFVDVLVNDTETPFAPWGLWSPAQTPSSVSLTWFPSTEGPGELTTGVAHHLIYRDGVLIAAVSGRAITYTDYSVVASTRYTYVVTGQNYCGTLSPASRSTIVVTPARASTIFGDQTPANPVENDSQPVEVGVQFATAAAGSISAIRFYRGLGSPTGYTVNLWTSNGTNLASASTVTDDNLGPGWREIRFSAPVPIVPGATYVASYFSSTGQYPDDVGGLNSEVVSGSLTALADGDAGPNGIYVYGSGFPSYGWYGSNYWVDVEFTASP